METLPLFKEEDWSPLTLSSAGSRSLAKMSRLPDNVPDWMGNVRLFGAKCFDSFAKLSPDGLWLKTYQGYSQVMTDGSLETFSGTWPAQGTMRNGECYRRPEWERRISDGECLSWPTPNVPNGGRLPKGGMSRTGMTPDGKKRQVGLENAVKRWPTPHANCSTGAGEKGTGGPNLQTVVGGQLNPTFVEWLMGFPLGWTDLGVSVTRSCRKSRRRSEK
jgi:hypothetical protein